MRGRAKQRASHVPAALAHTPALIFSSLSLCPPPPAAPEDDIVDEAIRLFRANVLFRNFEVLGGGDRVLVYLTLFIHQCLKKVEKKPNKSEALRELNTLAQGGHFIPGDAGWPLGSLIPGPKTASEAETLRSYYRQLREALVIRLADRVFSKEDGGPNKHWIAYSKKKFMNKEFP